MGGDNSNPTVQSKPCRFGSKSGEAHRLTEWRQVRSNPERGVVKKPSYPPRLRHADTIRASYRSSDRGESRVSSSIWQVLNKRQVADDDAQPSGRCTPWMPR